MVVTEEDGAVIVREINEAYDRIPTIIKPFVPSLTYILGNVPECAKKYALQELIEFLEKAHHDGRIP
ncbi:MAG: hypothetical protein ACE5OY_01650 [Candidatus Bathyarchaeia archaeon]